MDQRAVALDLARKGLSAVEFHPGFVVTLGPNQ
jgi:hypothetical protein